MPGLSHGPVPAHSERPPSAQAVLPANPAYAGAIATERHTVVGGRQRRNFARDANTAENTTGESLSTLPVMRRASLGLSIRRPSGDKVTTGEFAAYLLPSAIHIHSHEKV